MVGMREVRGLAGSIAESHTDLWDVLLHLTESPYVWCALLTASPSGAKPKNPRTQIPTEMAGHGADERPCSPEQEHLSQAELDAANKEIAAQRSNSAILADPDGTADDADDDADGGADGAGADAAAAGNPGFGAPPAI
jgi:hypothetical protein